MVIFIVNGELGLRPSPDRLQSLISFQDTVRMNANIERNVSFLPLI